jgi:hypothetical protein
MASPRVPVHIYTGPLEPLGYTDKTKSPGLVDPGLRFIVLNVSISSFSGHARGLLGSFQLLLCFVLRYVYALIHFCMRKDIITFLALSINAYEKLDTFVS